MHVFHHIDMHTFSTEEYALFSKLIWEEILCFSFKQAQPSSV